MSWGSGQAGSGMGIPVGLGNWQILWDWGIQAILWGWGVPEFHGGFLWDWGIWEILWYWGVPEIHGGFLWDWGDHEIHGGIPVGLGYTGNPLELGSLPLGSGCPCCPWGRFVWNWAIPGAIPFGMGAVSFETSSMPVPVPLGLCPSMSPSPWDRGHPCYPWCHSFWDRGFFGGYVYPSP